MDFSVDISPSNPSRRDRDWDRSDYLKRDFRGNAKGGNPTQNLFKRTCWNCGKDDHSMYNCREPKNRYKIALNKATFVNQHSKIDKSAYKPGCISKDLRRALGISKYELPDYIYRMRELGYPPGWLQEADSRNRFRVFNENGPVEEMEVKSENSEEGELLEENGKSSSYDFSKLIEFPGFNGPLGKYEDDYKRHDGITYDEEQFLENMIKNLKEASENKDSFKINTNKTEESDPSNTEEKTPKSSEEDNLAESIKIKEEFDDGTCKENNDTENGKSDGIIKKEDDLNTTPLQNEEENSERVMTPCVMNTGYDIPSREKFGEDMNEWISFENLPNYSGNYNNIKKVLKRQRNRTI